MGRGRRGARHDVAIPASLPPASLGTIPFRRGPARGCRRPVNPHLENRRIRISRPVSSGFFFETHPARTPMQHEITLPRASRPQERAAGGGQRESAGGGPGALRKRQ